VIVLLSFVLKEQDSALVLCDSGTAH